MLVITGENLNPYKALKDVMSSVKAHAVIDTKSIKVKGDLSDSTLMGFLEQNISAMSNVDSKEEVEEVDEVKNDEKEITLYKGGATYFNKPRTARNFNTVREARPNSWEFWRADFGVPVGRGEMGYIHYVLVYCEGDNPDSYIVFPCTSKYKEYDSIYRIKFNEENMQVQDEEFLEKSKETYILYNMREPLDISRFEKCVGVVKEKYVGEILTALKAAQNALESKALKNLDKSQISAGQRNLTKANISISNRQEKMMNYVCETDIFSIANNMNYTYERRVTALVNAFGLPVTGDGEFMIDFIKRCKSGNTHMETVLKSMARRKDKPYKVIYNKLVNLMRKRFKTDDVLEFAKLINTLAS